jgi:uncharacterized protein (TIGR04255 family)
MRFPESPRIVFEKDTIVEVICQLRFPKILAIGTKPPDDFQEAIRSEYPLYRKQGIVGPPPELAQMIEQFPMIPTPDTTTHWFESSDGIRVISLGTDFVAVTARQYPGWQVFRAEIERAVDALSEAYSPAFFERVGLRYRDVINREELGLAGRPWSELLQPGMISLLGADLGIDSAKDRIITDALLNLDVPPGAAVRLRHGFGGDGEHTYEIDADFFVEGSVIERGQALELLNTLNREEGHLFRWAIGDDLRTALGVERSE